MQETREHIKARMLKNAARTWGLPETESENNFDPLVSMLLSACSIELEKISSEIQGSRARVLERMVQLLSPEAFTGAVPAHAIATGLPMDKRTDLAENAQFYISRKFKAANENSEGINKDIFFTPTANFILNRCAINFVATGRNLYKVNGINKELIAQSESGDLPASSLWLGISEPDIPLHNSSFYFDLRNNANRALFYSQLPKAKWYWDDRTIQHVTGYGERNISGEQIDLKNILQKEDDISGKLKKHVNAFYKPSFITLSDPLNISTGSGNEAIKQMIDETFTGKAAEILQTHNLRWICVDFPQTISSIVLEDVVCLMNAFPVFNRKAYDLTYRMQEIVNVIPLQTEDLFLDLDEVSNDEGKVLSMRTFQKKEEDNVKILLRNGGVGRFDERDAVSLVDYLIQLLRDESAAFSALGNDFMNNEMKQLQQLINKLEQKIFSTELRREQIPYLVIRNNVKAPWKNIFIRYWSTSGTEANNIKADSTLMQYRGGNLDGGIITLVTSTAGGQNKLSTTESLLAFKSALLSRDRLITSEDIRAFCHYQLGERVEKIAIEKGIMIHADQQKGFMKTIDVMIDIKKNQYEQMSETGEVIFWMENLKLLLEQRSVALLPYRIFIKEAA